MDSPDDAAKRAGSGETKPSPRQRGQDASGQAKRVAPAPAGPGVGKARIVFRDETFLSQLDEIYDSLGAMIGQEVELIGFVYRGEDFAPKEFVVSRYAISCCAADAQVVGLLCQNATGRPVQKNAWVKVRGIIEEASYDGQACSARAGEGMGSGGGAEEYVCLLNVAHAAAGRRPRPKTEARKKQTPRTITMVAPVGTSR